MRLPAATLALVILLVLAGCGGPGTANETTRPPFSPPTVGVGSYPPPTAPVGEARERGTYLGAYEATEDRRRLAFEDITDPDDRTVVARFLDGVEQNGSREERWEPAEARALMDRLHTRYEELHGEAQAAREDPINVSRDALVAVFLVFEVEGETEPPGP